MLPITAVIISSAAVLNKSWHGLEAVVQHLPFYKEPKDLHTARLEALLKVKTTHFFYLDDDDDLPPDYLSVLEDCLSTDKPISYTNEKIITPQGNVEVSTPGAFSSEAYWKNPMLLHHLVLCNTKEALKVAETLPRGEYWTEFLLYWPLTQLAGAHYVPRIGYIWQRRLSGLSKRPRTVVSQMASRLHHRPTAPTF